MMDYQQKRLTLLSQYFYPEMISTGHILTELLVELARRQIKTTAICAQPTYYSNDKVDKEITYKGIVIRRTVNTQFDKNSIQGKIFNSFSFFVGALWLILKEKGRYPMILVTNPPFLGLAGLICKIFKRRPYLLIIHDLYPDIMVNMGYLRNNSLLSIIWKRINRSIYKLASFIVVLGQDVQREIQNQLPTEQHKKVKFIPNWADPELICPIDHSCNPFMSELGMSGKFLVQYSGNMGLTHDMETIIEAARVLEVEHDIHFLLIGGGGKLKVVKEMIKSHKLSNVTLLPYQPRENLKNSLGVAHISLISLEKGVQGLSVPSKLYGIMASGRPTIAIVPENIEVALTLKEFKCGLVAPPKDVPALVKAIKWLKAHEPERKAMGTRAYKAFQENFTVQQCANKYFHLIKQML